MALRVDISQDGHEEGGRLLLGDQLPAAGLTELQAGNRNKGLEMVMVVDSPRARLGYN